MYRLRFPLLAAMLLIAPAGAVWSAPVQSTRSGLDQVPETAPLVIHVRGIQGTHDRLLSLMKKALPGVADKFKSQIDDFFESGPENALKGRKLRGLKEDGPIFLIFTELPKPSDSIPKIAIILAVKDYKEFRKNILTEDEGKAAKDEGNGIESANMENTQTYFVDRKGYAIVTPDKEVADSFANSKKITGLHNKLSKEQTAKLLSSDLGLYVNMEAVNKEYGEQIKQARQGIEQLLAFAGAGDESQKQAMEMIKTALPHIFQTIEDVQNLMVTLELRSGGLALHLHGDLKESSTTASYVQDSRTVDFKELDRLPPDRSVYLGMKASGALFKKLGGLISGISGGGGKDSSDLMNELAKAGPDLILGGESFPSAGLTVYHFDKPDKAVAAVLKMYRSMDPKTANLKSKPDIKENAEKYGDFKLHSVQVAFDLDKMAEPAAAKGGEDAKKATVEALKGIIGEKKNVWFGSDGKTAVQVSAPDWETARKMLDQYTKGSGTAGEGNTFRDLRKEMPKQASILVMGDAVHLFKMGLDVVKPQLPPGVSPPADWPNMKDKGALAYIGLALTLQPNHGGIDLFLTADAVQEFFKVVIKPLVSE